MKSGISILALSALVLVLTITSYFDSIKTWNLHMRIIELCELCNQLTLENVDLKIKIKEAGVKNERSH